MADLPDLTAREMTRMVREKKISPVELLRAHLELAEKLQPKLNAFVVLDGDRALEQARAAEAAVMRGEPLGVLHGVPITIKSCIDVAVVRCETGSRLREGHVPQQDAPVVARLRSAGAIILGNTNVPEMLMAYETDNRLYGRTNNPWDVARTPGGSSGGEAAAVASGFSAAGLGSDGGGSIRVPAHFSGICGLKPTPGRIPATGHFPPSTGPFALLGVVGPMARTVGDLELLFRVIAGPDDGDVCAAPVRFQPVNKSEANRTRVGYFEDDGVTPVTPETRAAVRAGAKALEQAGFQVEAFRPEGLQRLRQLWWVFFGLTGGLVLRRMVAGRESELSPLLKEFLAQVSADRPLTLELFMNAWFDRDQCRTQLLAEMRDFPVLLCPVCAIPAFRHREREWKVNGTHVGYLDAERDVMSYTQWFNLTGNPAAVVPVGRSPEGLPIGVQVVGQPFEEELVLAVAGRIEQGCGGWRKPPLS